MWRKITILASNLFEKFITCFTLLTLCTWWKNKCGNFTALLSGNTLTRHKRRKKFTIELHPEQVIPLLFRFLGTTADESRKIIFPIIPVDHLSAIISNGVVSFVVDVIRKRSLMSLVFKATQWFKWYITVDRILTEIGHRVTGTEAADKYDNRHRQEWNHRQTKSKTKNIRRQKLTRNLSLSSKATGCVIHVKT